MEARKKCTNILSFASDTDTDTYPSASDRGSASATDDGASYPSASDTGTVLVENTDPALASVTVSPLSAKVGESLTCAAVACKIKGKSPQELRSEFGLKADLTAEELDQVRAENAWAHADIGTARRDAGKDA